MKKVYGKYFSCGYAVTSDSQGVKLDGMPIDQFQKWININSKCQVFGIYPKNIQDSDKYAGKEIQLNVKKVINNSQEVYFACIEWRMGWYLFYTLTDEEIIYIKNK